MVAVLIIPLCTVEGPYILPAATDFLPFYPLTTFFLVWVSFQTTHWFVSYPATTIYLCWPCQIPLPDKKNYFVRLFIMVFLSGTRWTSFLTIPHGMHLVVLTHPSLFWGYAISAGHFPQKSLSGNPRIGSPFFPPPNHTLSYL